jgi:hypothetical protein
MPNNIKQTDPEDRKICIVGDTNSGRVHGNVSN